MFFADYLCRDTGNRTRSSTVTGWHCNHSTIPRLIIVHYRHLLPRLGSNQNSSQSKWDVLPITPQGSGLLFFCGQGGNRTLHNLLAMEIRLLGTCQPDSGEVLPPPCFSVVLPSSVLTYFEDWNSFVWVFITSFPVWVKVQSFIPI